MSDGAAIPDPAYMARALSLAGESAVRTSPNPAVGCVVVRDGVVIGEGVTQAPGASHAEVVALAVAGTAAQGADLYVTLEPCCHHGRTPPCTDAILAAGVARVFVGLMDPNPKVSGGGIAALRAANLEVQVGVMAEACMRHHQAFTHFITTGRPWTILKAAVTLDGRIATASGDSKWITGIEARTDVHGLRAAVDAVMVGAGTALADNPRLNVRLVEGSDPLRVVVDSTLRLPLDAALVGAGTIVYHAPGAHEARRMALTERGATLVAVTRTARGLEMTEVMADLAGRGVVSVLVEGGGRLHGSLIEAGLVDEVCMYIAPKLIGRGRPVLDLPSPETMAQGWALEAPETRLLGDDIRIRGRIRYPAPPTSSAQTER